MHLSKRLQKIASLIDETDTFIYDVGCDHALLDIYLAQKYNNLKFCASDVSSKCIAKAKENIALFKMNDRINTLVNYGLEGIQLEKNATIVISGMGSHTIIDILTGVNLDNCKKIIVQANNDLPYLRRQIVKKGFKIVEEKVVYDKKFYVVITFEPGVKRYNNVEYQFGPQLLLNKDHYIDYFKFLYEQTNYLLAKVPTIKLKKRFKLKRELKILKKVIR